MEAPRHPDIARALGEVGRVMSDAGVRDGEAVVVGCSGGADSVALLGLLWRLARARTWRLVVAHVDHGLRSESASEAAHVRDMAGRLDLPCEITRVEVAPGPDLAARARHLRRGALGEVAARVGAHWIALGHTATDQVETVLLHLARGAGVAGLGGMYPWRDGVVRPLLGMSRARTRELATRMALPFVEDPTNEDVAHPRVRVRKEVLPALRTLNPSLETTVAEALGQVRGAAELVRAAAASAQAAQLQATGETPGAPSAPRLRAEGWRAIPGVVRVQALRQFCVAQGVDQDELAVVALNDVDAALCEWDAHLGSRGTAAGPGGARPRVFCVHPHRRLYVDRWGVRVESSDKSAADGG